MKLTLGLGVLSGSNLLLVFWANAYILVALGAGSVTDAFFGSLVLPQLVAGILATPLVGALLPQLAGEPEDRIRRRGWSALTASTAVLGTLALVLGLTAPAWIAVVLPGFDPARRELTVSLTKIQMAGLVFTAWLAIVTSVGQAKKRFIAVELAELLANAAAIAGLVIVLNHDRIAQAAWIFAARPLAAAVLLLPLLGSPGMLETGDRFLGELWRRLRAPLFGSTYIKMGFLVDRLLCSWAPAGFLSLYHFADKLVSAGVDVVRSSMITPAMPELTQHAKQGRWTEFQSETLRRLATIAWITIAAALALVAAGPILVDVFGDGRRFQDAQRTWTYLVALQGQLIAGSLAVALAYAFYAKGDTGTPTRVTMIATTLGILFKILLFPAWGLLAVAGGTSLLQCFNVVAMGALLRSRLRKVVSVFDYRKLEQARIPCPLCGSSEFDPLCANDRYWMGIQTAACGSCGYLMTNPAPTEAALGEFYRTHYRRYYRKVDRPSREHIRKYELDRRAAYAAGYLQAKELIGPGKSILDVGCAEGSLLKEIQRLAPDSKLVGVEPGEGFAEFCRTYVGCEVFPTLDEAARSGRGPFDGLILIHVLEHVGHPVEFLKSLRRHLKEDGALYVDVPDAAAYRSLDDLHIAHLHHFTPKTLAEAARKAAYVVADMNRHQPPRHPASLRCILRLRGTEAPIPQVEGEDEKARDRIASFDRSLLSYRLSRSLPARIIRGVFRRVMR